jgi:hypothetical protein
MAITVTVPLGFGKWERAVSDEAIRLALPPKAGLIP